MNDTSHFQRFGADYLPGHLGIEIVEVSAERVRAALTVRKALLAPNGFLHAGTVVTLADTCAALACLPSLDERMLGSATLSLSAVFGDALRRSALAAGASGFTTIELKSNHLGTAIDGVIECVATPAHLGRTTQVWDATVTHRASGKTIALFRCTQMVLYKT